MITIEINDKEYNIEVADTDELKEKGLQDVTELPENQGMLFVYDEPQEVGYWMKDTYIPLDIIFINEDWEVISVVQGVPEDDTILEESDVMYVLELNANSGIKAGDEVDLENLDDDDDEILDLKKSEEDEDEEENKQPMLVLGNKGKVQMELQGGERIFSRKNTKSLARIAKRAYKSKLEKDYKMLGRKLFQYLKTQDNKEDNFVEIPEK